MERLKTNNAFNIIEKNLFKVDLIELLLNGEWQILEKVIDLDLTKKQYDNFDLSVKKVYEDIWYNYKWKWRYLPNELNNFLYELNLNTFSVWDYLLYFTFKTKDEQYWYFYISLFEWSSFLDDEGLSFSNKYELNKFIKEYIIKEYIIKDFFNKMDWLEEIKIFIWKNESVKPINNKNLLIKQITA